MKKLFLLLIIAFPVISISCNKDDDSPESNVTIVQGIEPVNGLYRYVENETDTNDYVFSGVNNFSFSIYNGEGTSTFTAVWQKEGCVMTFDYGSFIERTKVLFFEKDGKNYFNISAMEKTSGNMNELPGEYEGSQYTSMDDKTVAYKLNVLEDGTYRAYYTKDNSEMFSGTWTLDEVKNGDIYFVDYMDKRFIILNNPKITIGIKQ